ncbi:MAG: DNA alkylation repair protein [Anaerolineae bacterium]
MTIDLIYNQLVSDLEEAGKNSPYPADANELDPRYKAYGVRSPEKKSIFKAHRPNIRQLNQADQIKLAERLIKSGFGEQQTLGLFILQPLAHTFTPDKFNQIDELIRCLHGWSKVDEFAGSLLRDILFAHPAPFLELVKTWNSDPDLWLRRMSVVLFTRKVAKSGTFTDFALDMCHNLMHAPEDLVQKGVGWALKDLMRADKDRILELVYQLRKEGVSSTITLYAIRDLKGEERANFLARE